jgi:glycosyltransferase involved in cell wall biosynthesis
LRILHISTSDISGGAAKAAYRQHRALQADNNDSRMYVAVRLSDDPTVLQYRAGGHLFQRATRRMRFEYLRWEYARNSRNRPANKYESFTDDRVHYGIDITTQMPAADIINLHWIGHFIDFKSFFMYVRDKFPIVWTLHDMNPFTGGCHYDYECGKFHFTCGACPQLGSNKVKDLSYDILKRKHMVLSMISPKTTIFVGNSDWTTQQARNSAVLKQFNVHTVHLGLDTKVFAPLDKKEARQRQNLPLEDKIVLFISTGLWARRKGFRYLVDALHLLNNRDKVTLVSVGNDEGIQCSVPVRHIHIPHTDQDVQLVDIYNAADLLVIPSLQESFGQTALEAAACGVPAVGFNQGGIPDAVKHNRSGILVETGDKTELAQGISRLISDDALRTKMGHEARCYAESEFSLKKNAYQYSKLYETLLEDFARYRPKK